MGISERIISIRKSKGITQTFIAERLEMDRGNYSKLEKRGAKMTIEQLQSIADALEVPVVELLGVESRTNEEESGKVEELEKHVNELKELAELHRERYDKMMSNADLFKDSLISEIREEMTYMAFKKGFLNESNTKGYFYIEMTGEDTYEYFFDEVIDEKYDTYRDFFISELLTENQLISLIEQLPSIYMYGLDFLGNADLIPDEKLKRARNKMYDRMLKSSKAKKYPDTPGTGLIVRNDKKLE